MRRYSNNTCAKKCLRRGQCAAERGGGGGVELALLILLLGLLERNPPWGNFRRWFRIRCQNWNPTFVYEDRASGKIPTLPVKFSQTVLLRYPEVVLDGDTESVFRIQKFCTLPEIYAFLHKILYYIYIYIYIYTYRYIHTSIHIRWYNTYIHSIHTYTHTHTGIHR